MAKKNLNDNLNDAKKNTKDLQQEMEYVYDAVISLSEKLVEGFKEAVANAVELGEVTEDAGKILQKGYSKDLKDLTKITEDIIKATALHNRGLLKSSEIEKLRKKLIEAEVIAEVRRNTAIRNGIPLSEEQTNELQKQVELTKEVLNELESGANKYGALFSFAEEKIGSYLKKFNAKDIGAAILIQIGKSLQELDTRSANLSRNFALSRTEGIALNQALAKSALAANTLGVNLRTVTEAVNSLNESLGGTALIFTEEIRNEVAFLQERLKLSAEASAELAKTAFIQGKGVKQVREEQEKAFKAIKASTGVTLNFTQTLEEANKITGATRLNLDKFPGGIVEAVAAAKSLGTELETIKGIQSSILDFESSIKAELEAEALINREINLEQARLAALNNDYLGVVQEISKEFGSVAEFQQLNFVQQQAFAKALGTTSDGLADILRKGESIQANLESGVETQEESLAANASIQSVQEQLKSSIEALNTTLQTTVGLLSAAAIAVGFITGGATAITAGLALGGAGLLAIGAQSGFGGVIPTGDLSIDPNGGPIVASPQQGTIYQGKSSDALAMGPAGGINGNREIVAAIQQLGNDFKNIKLRLDMDSRRLNDSMNTSGVSYLS